MRPQLPSRVSDTLDAWVELISAEFLPADVQVIDGPPAGPLDSLKDDVIVIGRGTPDEPGAVSTITRESGLGLQAYTEHVEVTLILSSFSGSQDMKARRHRVSELLAAVKGVVDANQIRAGVWDQAFLGNEQVWHPVQTDQGASCAVGLVIVTEAII